MTEKLSQIIMPLLENAEIKKEEEKKEALDPLAALEQRLINLIDLKHKEIQEQITQVDNEIQDRLDVIYENTMQNSKQITNLDNLCKNLENKLNLKVNLTDFETSNIKIYENIKEMSENNAKIIEKININIAKNDQDLLNYKSQTNKTIENLQKLIENNQQNIDSIFKKFDQYLTVSGFSEFSTNTTNSHNSLLIKLLELQNNINPCAFLKPLNGISLPEHEELLKKSPNTFLKNLFDRFYKDAKVIIDRQNEKIIFMESLLDNLKKNLNINLYAAAKKAFSQLQAKSNIDTTFFYNFMFFNFVFSQIVAIRK